MAHFDHFDLHRRRVHHPAFHRDDVVTPDTDTSSNTPTPTPQSLIIPVAPTIIGDPFTTIATTPTPSSSPPPVQSTATTSSAVPPSLTPSSLSLSLTSTTTSTTLTSSSPAILSTPTTTSTTSQSSSTPATTPTFIQTIVNPSGVHTSTVSPSPTGSSSPVSGTSTGIIVGGIIAAILGSAGILAAVVYFLRKCRGRQDEAFSEEIWNRSDARRRSAALGADTEPVRPYGAPPRPPSMIERHLNNTPSMPPRQPTLPNVYPNNAYGNGYGATNYSPNSFSPGHVVSPNSANPFFSPYAQDVMASPVSSTVPEYYDPPHPGNPAFLPQALTREPPIRTGPVPVAHQNLVTGGPFSPVVSSPDAADPHYTDLSRSSVTPFQAAQYAEITEKLGAPMSSVLGAVSEERQAAVFDNMAAPSYDDPSTRGVNMHTESPFVDAPVVQQPIGDPSYESDDELPLPSPNAFNQTRIPSLPPTLPEIHVPERSFSPVASLEFPVPLSVRSSPSTISAEFSDLRGPPPSEPNHKSSPLATSTPMRAQEQPTVIPREPKTGAAPTNRPDTVYTVYDEEDAYGGF